MPDDIDKFMAEKQQLESRRQDLIKEILRQKEAAIKAFDEKLARLGHQDGDDPKRSHHTRGIEKKPSAKPPTSST